MKKLIENSCNYFVDETGRVFRGNRELRKNKGNNGYTTVSIKYEDGTRKLRFVHRLVAQAFIPNPENKPVVNHLNLVKNDNRVENLEWCTHKENNVHAHRNGAFRKTGRHHHAKYPDELIHKVCLQIQEGRRDIDISRNLIVPKHLLYNIRNKISWMHISDKYVNTAPRIRRYSDNSIIWLSHRIAEGKTNREISELSRGKFSPNTVNDIRRKRAYKDITDKYF